MDSARTRLRIGLATLLGSEVIALVLRVVMEQLRERVWSDSSDPSLRDAMLLVSTAMLGVQLLGVIGLGVAVSGVRVVPTAARGAFAGSLALGSVLFVLSAVSRAGVEIPEAMNHLWTVLGFARTAALAAGLAVTAHGRSRFAVGAAIALVVLSFVVLVGDVTLVHVIEPTTALAIMFGGVTLLRVVSVIAIGATIGVAGSAGEVAAPSVNADLVGAAASDIRSAVFVSIGIGLASSVIGRLTASVPALVPLLALIGLCLDVGLAIFLIRAFRGLAQDDSTRTAAALATSGVLARLIFGSALSLFGASTMYEAAGGSYSAASDLMELLPGLIVGAAVLGGLAFIGIFHLLAATASRLGHAEHTRTAHLGMVLVVLATVCAGGSGALVFTQRTLDGLALVGIGVLAALGLGIGAIAALHKVTRQIELTAAHSFPAGGPLPAAAGAPWP